LVSKQLNSAYGPAFYWLSDNKTLICKLVPVGRGEPPIAPSVPEGPVIQETTGRKAPARTYQDLLTNAHDEALFEYYLDAEIYRVSLDGQKTKIGSRGLIKRAEPSPNGQYLLVETLHRPFSYIVPARRFPNRVEIWDLEGKVVKQLADLPLAEEVPIGRGAVPTGRRSFDWRSDAPATVYWAEAQDGGNPRKKAEVRDKVFTLQAPFTSEPMPLIELALRYRGIGWGDKNLALVQSWWGQSRRIQTWMIQPDDPDSRPDLLFDYSAQDRYSDPGSPILQRNKYGHMVLLTDSKGKKLYLKGAGASPEGDRPFLDELTLSDKTTKRLWRSQAPYYETAVELLDPRRLKVLTRRESKEEPPNYFVRELKKDKITQVTDFPHPTPQLAKVQKELIRYDREDGVKLTATLYLPPGYKPEDGPLPMVMWAYPREYKSARAASQVRGSPYRFTTISPTSSRVWLAMGYALLDGPTMPIIGEGDTEPNDKYVEQLVASAKAAVDEVVRRGVAERGRIAIGGHSYGAFMTANLLSHSDLFSAGIARSGAYNRTLTPFGFQAEERTFWQAPEIYFKMSPFMHAQKVNEPILLIHGEADNNSGTFPVQSKRYYHALKGNGAKARLVMLPHESHGYRTRESILHMLWETNNWLERYVKNPTAEQKTTETSMR
ncbi:prolyl oligopeptidase family serine peptidase, partial [bacterium]|nr:prolyl oligopeptidase family serine peptidase [bacterium]